MKFGQSPSQPDMGQYFGSLVRQYGPEAQHLLIPRRGDFGIHADNAPELIPAHDEPRVVTAMAPVFEQQPAQRRQRPAIARPRCRPGQILLHFPS